MLLSSLTVPIVLAPLAGGPSTPELAAAVTDAGGLGFIAGGYLTAAELTTRLNTTRSLTQGAVGVNIFTAMAGPADPEVYRRFLARLQDWTQREGLAVGEPRFSDDEWEAKLKLLEHEAPPVVSFTFGCPDTSVVARLQAVGSEVWVTVTSPREAELAAQAGADVLVLQGAEAGGHRGSFADHSNLALYGLLPLIALVRETVSLPLVASGGIATGESLAAVLCAGAAAAQIGTAFMLCPEAGTSRPHRAVLTSPTETALTRAFTGRLARGIRNRFLDEFTADAPVAYPELHYVTSPVRRQAREVDNPEHLNLWAGEGHQLARAEPAAQVVRRLYSQAQAALTSAGAATRAAAHDDRP